MTLARRNVGTSEPARGRSSSMWEEEADAYWQRMEPGRKSKALMRSVGVLVLALVVCSAAFTSWNALREIEFASLSSRLLAKIRPSDVNSNASTATTTMPSAPSATVTNIELLRSRCRVRGVQTRWHEETCRKLCAREPFNSACMNGCSYGSITTTKLTCEQLTLADVAAISSNSVQQCPLGVNCEAACAVYDAEKPYPAVRNACARSCANIVSSSCTRILQIYYDLYHGTLQ